RLNVISNPSATRLTVTSNSFSANLIPSNFTASSTIRFSNTFLDTFCFLASSSNTFTARTSTSRIFISIQIRSFHASHKIPENPRSHEQGLLKQDKGKVYPHSVGD